MTETPQNENLLLRLPEAEAMQMLRALAQADKRSMGQQAAFLIEAAYAARFSQPSPYTLAEAEAALSAK